MDEKKPKCFTAEEIEKIKEISKDSVRHSMNPTDLLNCKDNMSTEENE